MLVWTYRTRGLVRLRVEKQATPPVEKQAAAPMGELARRQAQWVPLALGLRLAAAVRAVRSALPAVPAWAAKLATAAQVGARAKQAVPRPGAKPAALGRVATRGSQVIRVWRAKQAEPVALVQTDPVESVVSSGWPVAKATAASAALLRAARPRGG